MKPSLFVLLIFCAGFFSAGTGALEKVDLQFAVSGSEDEILKALDLRRRDVIEREIYLFDTDELAFLERRIQIRLRIENDEAELGVKRWGIDPADFARLQELFGSQCEVDVHGSTLIRSCAVKRIIPAKKAFHLVSDDAKLLDVFNREQIALLFEGGSPPLVMLREAQPFGPIGSRSWEWHDANDSKFSIDIQKLPDKQRFIELSMKIRTGDAIKEKEKLEKDLRARGLALEPDQHGRRTEKLTGLLNCARLLKSKSSPKP